ncbi:MAG: hypothetical protein IKW67_00010 [Alphaproteobacteria bacterium]|nr:hypothetical protein [Alphaproteobacteria bacterium]
MKKIFSVFFMMVFIVGAGYAADSSCDNPDNDYITAELALCSTHAYNIGEVQNPTGANRELMQEVVAMKTTVIAKQLYKQYEEMELMMRRLKTQLDKSLTLAALKIAAGESGNNGGDDSSSGAYSSSSGRDGLGMAQNCLRSVNDINSAKQCLQSNINLIQRALDDGDRTAARKQLINDLNAAMTWGIFAKDKEPEGCKAVIDGDAKKKEDVQKCLDSFRVTVNQYKQSSNKQQYVISIPQPEDT